MAGYLACIGLTQADDSDSVWRLGEAQNMKPLIQNADGDIARLSIRPPIIHLEQCVLEIEVDDGVER